MPSTDSPARRRLATRSAVAAGRTDHSRPLPWVKDSCLIDVGKQLGLLVAPHRVHVLKDQPWLPFQRGFLRLITSNRFFRRTTTEPGFLASERMELRTFMMNLVSAGRDHRHRSDQRRHQPSHSWPPSTPGTSAGLTIGNTGTWATSVTAPDRADHAGAVGVRGVGHPDAFRAGLCQDIEPYVTSG